MFNMNYQIRTINNDILNYIINASNLEILYNVDQMISRDKKVRESLYINNLYLQWFEKNFSKKSWFLNFISYGTEEDLKILIDYLNKNAYPSTSFYFQIILRKKLIDYKTYKTLNVSTDLERWNDDFFVSIILVDMHSNKR